VKGATLSVIVDTVNVGSIVLDSMDDKSVWGELNLDTKPNADDNRLPFPANWPTTAGKGSTVDLKLGDTEVLGCTLG
jgi:hypothetical protein